jgi:phage-related protein
LEELPDKKQAKFAALSARLGDIGKIYNEQKFKHLTGTKQIFEFKVDDSRILTFFFAGKRMILTHGFTKKNRKTPRKEIEMAEQIKEEFEQRIRNEKKE